MRRPNATAVLTTPGAVRADGITSSSGMRATGEKKCIPITCSGRRAASAMRPIGMVEVLDANTARSADRKSTRLNSSHGYISYAVFCLKKKKQGEARGGRTVHHLDQ